MCTGHTYIFVRNHPYKSGVCIWVHFCDMSERDYGGAGTGLVDRER